MYDWYTNINLNRSESDLIGVSFITISIVHYPVYTYYFILKQFFKLILFIIDCSMCSVFKKSYHSESKIML